MIACITPFALFRQWLKSRKFQRFYKQFIHAGDLCFDLGANHGRYTRMFLRLGARVVAVEPQTHCVTELKTRYANNSHVQVIHAAAGAVPGTATLHLANEDAISTLSPSFIAAYSQSETLAWPRTAEVAVITLEQLIATHGLPTFIKIDVEGYEPEVLAGLQHAPLAISFEYNVRLREQAETCVQRLMSLGDCRFNFSAYEHGRWQWPEWCDGHAMQQAVRALPPGLLTGDIFARYQKP
jgi:FkbM family methyltransferase